MIGGLRSAAAVFSREAFRTARRWQTWALRVAFAAVLFAVVVSFWASAISPVADPASAALIGRRLFLGYAVTQVILVGLIAPVLVGQGIVEERDGATLPLLALTRLTPGQILWGKVGSRLTLVGTFVLAGTPLLAASTTFGGVGPVQVVNVVVNTLVLLVVLGLLGGLFGLLFDGALAIVSAVALWYFAALGVAPLVYAGVIQAGSATADVLSHVSPGFALVEDGPEGLLPVLAMLPVALAAIRWAGPLFALATTDPDEGHGHVRSPEALRVEQQARATGWLGLWVVIASLVVLVALVAIAETWGGSARGHLATQVVAWLFTVLLITSSTGLLVLLLLRASQVRRVLFAGLVRARETAAARGSGASPLTILRGRVVGHPVVWREAFTNAFGFSSLLARWAFPLWVLGTVWFGIGRFSVAETVGVLAVTGALFGSVVTMSIAGETIVDERRRGTLELMATTTMGSANVVLAKVGAVALLAGPYYGVGLGSALAWWLVSRPIGQDYYEVGRAAMCGDWSLAPGALAPRAALVAVWIASAWALGVLGVMLGSLWARPPRLSWLFGVAIVGGAIVGPFLADELLPDPFGEWVLSLLVPFEERGGWAQCGTSPWLVASTLVYASAAGALFLACAASLRRVVQRDLR